MMPLAERAAYSFFARGLSRNGVYWVGVPMTDGDTMLVGRAKTGDRAAFEELVRRTGRLVFAKLYLDTGDPHRAEDLLQDTYLLAFRSLHQLADPAGFRAWLLAVAHRAMLDAAKRDSRLKRSGPTAAGV